MQQTETTTQSVLQAIQPLLERLASLEAPESFVCAWLKTLTLPTQALITLGSSLFSDGASLLARAIFAECVRREPDNPIALHNLGVTLQQLGDFENAAHTFHQARCRQALENAGNSLTAEAIAWRHCGNFGAAEQLFRLAIAHGHDTPNTRWGLALTLLSAGCFETAWPLYESRYQRPDKPSWAIMDESQWPMWRGESLTGKRLLLVGEQGLGDQIQFARLIPLIAEQAERVEMLVSPALKGVFASIKELAAVHDVRPRHLEFDYWVYLLSIPLHMGLNTPAALTAKTLTISPNPDLVATYRPLIEAAAGGKKKIGLIWSGNPEQPTNPFRSLELDSLVGILGLDVCWISLQQRIPERDRQSPWLPRLLDLGTGLTSMEETAAILAQLDLLITVDSGPSHLAASLNIPTWVFLSHHLDWRYSRTSKQTFWYPSMTLFHQEKPGDWSVPLANIRQNLAKLITSPVALDVCTTH